MAQSALSVFCISDVAAKEIGLNQENLYPPVAGGKANLLLRRYVETATRTRTAWIGAISGSAQRVAYSDPILTIELGGWVITRGGLANCEPGTLIDASMIANWRNGATAEGQENHFGWDVLHQFDIGGGYKFVVQNTSYTRGPGSLSEASLQLALECTGSSPGGGGGVISPPVDNGGGTAPEVGVVQRIVTIYTSEGSYQVLTTKPNPTLDDFFGSSAGAWDDGPPARRAISGMPLSNPDSTVQLPPINVLGVNIQADSGMGSAPGGEWMAGSSAEVISGGFVPVEPGTTLWFFVLPNDGNLGRENIFMVSGYDFQPDALASIGKTESEFVSIYFETPKIGGGRTNGWTKGKIDGVNLGSYFM